MAFRRELRKRLYRIQHALTLRWPWRRRWAFGEGECGTCGFLGNRQEPPPPTGEIYHEVSQAQRTTGHIIAFVSQPPNSYETSLKCFINQADLYRELKHEAPDEEAEGKFSRQTYWAVLDRQGRHCPYWVPYQPGYDPKRNLERIEMHRFEDTQRTMARWTAIQAIVAILAIVAVILAGLFLQGRPTVENTIVIPTPIAQSTPGTEDSPLR